MVLENSEGRVDFDIAAAEVEFFVKTHPNADGDTVITAYDGLDQIIGTPISIAAGSNDPTDPLGKGFSLVSLSGNIDHIVFDNQATNIMNAIDDFGFTAIPEPSSLAIIAGALSIALAACRRRNQ